MSADRLRASILQAAISGQLTEQRPEDGTATELLEEISAHRAKLLKEGKFKKQKPLPPIAIEDQPFPIPESWQWARIMQLSSTVSMRGRTVKRKEVLAQGDIPVVSQSMQQIDGYVMGHEGLQYVTDLPVIVFGDHNRFVKFIDFPFVVGADGTKVLSPKLINARYFFYLITWAAESLRNRGYGRHFSLLRQVSCPLAPLPEQERIVAKLDEVMPLIDQFAELEKERGSI